MSSISKHRNFLEAVEEYIRNNPEVGPYVTEFIANGIAGARQNDMQRAADFEAALAHAIQKRQRTTDKRFVLDTMRKWDGKAALSWTEMINLYEMGIDQ